MSNPIRWRRILAAQAGAQWWPVLIALTPLSIIYLWVVTCRNRIFDRRGPSACLDVPVISVGNITVGGTGKTPVVIDLVKRMETLGRTVAVVARGYGAVDGKANDEERLIRKHCPNVVYIANANRAEGGASAIKRFGANTIVLDDGFQHRKLKRDLDIVLIDATCPFGFGYLLPRGLLREPISSLTRASVIVLSRCDQVSAEQLQSLGKKLASIAPSVPLLRSTHRVVGLQSLAEKNIDYANTGLRAVLFGGIGHPEAFVKTVRSMNIEVVGEHWWPDHHNYQSSDLNQLMRIGRFPNCDIFLTTEKDAVKLCELKRTDAMEGIEDAAIGVVKIAIDFNESDDTILQGLVEQTLKKC